MVALPIVNTKMDAHAFPAWNTRVGTPLRGGQQTPGSKPASLNDLIRQMPALPLQTAILGESSEHTPVLFDLNDPRPGSLLIVGERYAGKTGLIKTMVHSLLRTNRPYEVQFSVISAKPGQWSLEENRYGDYFKVITSNYERDAADAILAACDLIESRQHGRMSGGAHLVILDGMDTLPYMDFDVRLNFEWLLQEGPFYQVWPVVACDVQTARQHPQWISLFRSRLTGYIEDPTTARELSLLPTVDFSAFERGRQFAVRIGRANLQFWTPEI